MTLSRRRVIQLALAGFAAALVPWRPKRPVVLRPTPRIRVTSMRPDMAGEARVLEHGLNTMLEDPEYREHVERQVVEAMRAQLDRNEIAAGTAHLAKMEARFWGSPC